MIFKRGQKADAARDHFLSIVQSHLGYQAELLGRNKFGQRVGYDSQPWAGAFIDVCLREAGLRDNFPSFVSTSAAVSEIFRQGNFSREPQRGDIVMFNFSSMSGHAAGAFNQPHCGVVIDAREFESTGRFVTIEGNTSTSAQSSTATDGVYQKVRHATDIMIVHRSSFNQKSAAAGNFLTFLLEVFDGARTRFTKDETDAIQASATEPPTLKVGKEIKYGARNRRVEIIQLALATVTDLRGAEPGRWDKTTSAACERFQRNIGRTGKDATGMPDRNTLKRLAEVTGLFIVPDEE
jgi:hypothetical protein